MIGAQAAAALCILVALALVVRAAFRLYKRSKRNKGIRLLMMEIPSGRIEIAAVQFHASGRLAVIPKLDSGRNFRFIWRAGMNISWDDASRAILAPKSLRNSPADGFREVLDAAKDEYGVTLAISPDTRWSIIPEKVRAEIKQCSKREEAN